MYPYYRGFCEDEVRLLEASLKLTISSWEEWEMQQVSQDLLWKELISEFFQEFLEFFFPEVYREIDFECGFKSLNPELRGEEVTKGLRVADLLFEVTLKSRRRR